MRIAVLDIGGTFIKSGIFDGGKVEEIRETPTNAIQGGRAVLDTAKAVISGYDNISAIGISTAGQVDFKNGSIKYANSNIPGYTGMKIRDELSSAFGLPVAVENDVNAAALGEASFGSGKGFSEFICLTYGTGVGGAIVINNDIYRGSSFSAGEMGAMTVHPEDRDASVDMYSGCYEKYASATALVNRVMKLDPMLDNGKKIFSDINRAEIKNEIDLWINEVGYGLISLIHIFNPQAVLLGGGIMEQPYVLEGVRRYVYSNIMESYREVKLLNTGLGNRAGLYGAASLALNIISEQSILK